MSPISQHPLTWIDISYTFLPCKHFSSIWSLPQQRSRRQLQPLLVFSGSTLEVGSFSPGRGAQGRLHISQSLFSLVFLFSIILPFPPQPHPAFTSSLSVFLQKACRMAAYSKFSNSHTSVWIKATATARATSCTHAQKFTSSSHSSLKVCLPLISMNPRPQFQ